MCQRSQRSYWQGFEAHSINKPAYDAPRYFDTIMRREWRLIRYMKMFACTYGGLTLLMKILWQLMEVLKLASEY